MLRRIILLSQITTIRGFHTGGILEAGRRGGSSSLVPDPRPFSKKQKKRRKSNFELSKDKIDQRKEKINASMLKKKFDRPEVEQYLSEMEKSLEGPMTELMLPDSVRDEMNTLKEVPRKKVNPHSILKELRYNYSVKANASKPISASTASELKVHNDDELQLDATGNITIKDVQEALAIFARRGDSPSVTELYHLLPKVGFEVTSPCHIALMIAASKNKDIKKVDEIFYSLITTGADIDLDIWGAFITIKADLGDPDEALKQIDQLLKFGANVRKRCDIFTAVLKSYLKKQKYEEMLDLWLRMKVDGIELTKEPFALMIKQCAYTSQPERAFFYLDELRAYNLTPDNETFAALFRACAEAPYWVKGYHDYIFDAMLAMEGYELIPTASAYNSLISSLARSGDAEWAEFYYWEMRRKGLKQSTWTYNSLLNAYARSQAVGARHYGILPRFVNAEPEPTEEESVMRELGSLRTTEIKSQHVWMDGDTASSRVRSSKKQPLQLRDDAVDDPEVGEAVWQQMKAEAGVLREKREQQAKLELERGSRLSSLKNHQRLSQIHTPAVLGGGGRGRMGQRSNKNNSFGNSFAGPSAMMEGEADDQEIDSGSSSWEYEDDDVEEEEDGDELNWLDANDIEADADVDSDDDADQHRGNSDREEAVSNRVHRGRASRFSKRGSSATAAATKKFLSRLHPDDVMSLEDLIEDLDVSPRDREEILSSSVRGVPEAEDEVEVEAEWRRLEERGRREVSRDSDGDRDEEHTASMEGAERSAPRRSGGGRKRWEAPKRGRPSTATATPSSPFDEMEDKLNHGGEFPDTDSSNKYYSAHRDDYSSKKRTTSGKRIPASASAETPSLPSFLALSKGKISQQDVEDYLATKRVHKEMFRSYVTDMVNVLDNPTAGTDMGTGAGRAGAAAVTGPGSDSEGLDIFRAAGYRGDVTVSPETLDQSWDLINFGRPPPADRSLHYRERQQNNIDSAEELLREMKRQHIPYDAATLASLLSVYSEALDVEGALRAMERFQQEGFEPNEKAFNALIKMHIRCKSVEAAMKTKELMISSNMVPDKLSYGLIIESYTQRAMVVEALQQLEQAADFGIRVPEKHVRMLRGRCLNLGIVHPNLPADPKAWAKKTKQIRKDTKMSSQSKIQHLSSFTYR